MKHLRFATLGLALVSLAGCTDTDGDGITDSKEEKLGLSIDNPDTDEDGVMDGDELDLGTDPLMADTDEDGFDDGVEIERGTDPLDPTSYAYHGGWPTNPNRVADSEKAEANTTSTAQVGKPIPPMTLWDQHGEKVNLYDFAGNADYIVVDVFGQWCPPCNQIADMMSVAYESGSGDPSIVMLNDMMDDGTVIYLSIMAQDNDYELPAKKHLKQWERAYPHPLVPILADKGGNGVSNGEISQWNNAGFFPSFAILDSEMNVIQSGIGFNDVLTFLSTK